MTESKILCETQEPTVLGDVQTAYAGQHGLRHYEGATGTSSLMTSFEVAENEDTEGDSENTISGYFKAPVDGRYKFHMSCSKKCKLYLSGVPVPVLVEENTTSPTDEGDTAADGTSDDSGND